jgi:organic hydroperoxide reductase OsmC/OhrA
MASEHEFSCQTEWTGNRGEGTSGLRKFDRTWSISTPGRAVVEGSADPQFGGKADRPNPEDLLMASLSACHMLWYLHLATVAGIVVQSYVDKPVGYGEVEKSGVGRFLRATLRPHIVLAAGTDQAKADAIHHEIHKYCFIARSVNFPIDYAPSYAEA